MAFDTGIFTVSATFSPPAVRRAVPVAHWHAVDQEFLDLLADRP